MLTQVHRLFTININYLQICSCKLATKFLSLCVLQLFLFTLYRTNSSILKHFFLAVGEESQESFLKRDHQDVPMTEAPRRLVVIVTNDADACSSPKSVISEIHFFTIPDNDVSFLKDLFDCYCIGNKDYSRSVYAQI
ncbi:hypothetical protein TNIN_160451 [Trichonephila inaurata madagascariensis]|uniref:Uncharacterized protein n=1 Tax=Trichonephila inaurata madagascariensis TaxID=2747483 RepID=A0A8X7BZ84_9ARAC|nr:hypothetical protein TNIN_160451 [Trichonephila inaurata madagascariensis]